jgi:hypothetical protein
MCTDLYAALMIAAGLAATWFSAKADNGVTPAMYATTMGLARLNQLAHSLLQQQAAERLQAQRLNHRPVQQQQARQWLDTQVLIDQQQQQQQEDTTQPPLEQEDAVDGAMAGAHAASAKQTKQQQQEPELPTADLPSLPAAVDVEHSAAHEPCTALYESVKAHCTAAQEAGDTLQGMAAAANSSSSSWGQPTTAAGPAAAEVAAQRLSQECAAFEHASSTDAAGSCSCSAAAAAAAAVAVASVVPEHAAAAAAVAEDIDEGVAAVDARRPESFLGSEAPDPCSNVGSDSSRSSFESAPVHACWDHAAPHEQHLEPLQEGSSSSCCSSSSAAAAAAAATAPAGVSRRLEAVVTSDSSRTWPPSADLPHVTFNSSSAVPTMPVAVADAASAVAPGAAAKFAAGCLLAFSSHLQRKPWLRLALLAAGVTLQLTLALLLLASMLLQAQGLLLLCVAGLIGCTMLQRLLAVLGQPQAKPHRGLTDAASLQRQLQLLLRCCVKPLGVPHNRWTLAFDDTRLEDRYRKVCHAWLLLGLSTCVAT